MSTKIELTDESKVKTREVILKGLNDASFKERLLKNPKEAINELYPGYATKETRKVVAYDQTDKNTLFINVSDLEYILFGGDQDAIELSQEDLDQVAGGVALAAEYSSCRSISCIF
jgi:hypothetical protein